MPLGPYGGITIDGVQLSTDPATYKPVEWVKRVSYHPTLGGGGVIQDFGMWQRDAVVVLESGPSNPIDRDVVKAVQDRQRQAGLVVPFTDWLGNEYTVIITDFRPEPLKSGRGADQQPLHLFTYTARCAVVSIVKLWGVAYTGF